MHFFLPFFLGPRQLGAWLSSVPLVSYKYVYCMCIFCHCK